MSALCAGSLEGSRAGDTAVVALGSGLGHLHVVRPAVGAWRERVGVGPGFIVGLVRLGSWLRLLCFRPFAHGLLSRVLVGSRDSGDVAGLDLFVHFSYDCANLIPEPFGPKFPYIGTPTDG